MVEGVGQATLASLQGVNLHMLMSLNSSIGKFLVFLDGAIPYISRVSPEPVAEVPCSCLPAIDHVS